jgi:cell division protein FtsQ
MSAAPARRLLGLLVAVVLLAGAWLWVRDSSVVAVRDVEVTGATGPQADAIRAALTAAGRDQTTLHVRGDALRKAAEPYPIVRDLAWDTDLPRGLRIRVVEHDPVAALRTPSGPRVPVAGDGRLLRGAAIGGDVPDVAVRVQPAGDRLTDRRALAGLSLLAAAPRPLRRQVERLSLGPSGWTAVLRQGPRVAFGDSSRPNAKWASLAAVLSAPDTAGTTRVDVQVPERPSASGLEQIAEQLQPSTEG